MHPLNRSSIFLILILNFNSSCTKIANDITIDDISFMPSYNWEDVHLIDQTNYVVTGGNVWDKGIRLSSNDGGNSWEMDSVGNKTILSMFVDQDGRGCAGGVDGNFYTFSHVLESWQYHRLDYWDMMQDVCLYESNYYLAYGQSFKDGRVLSLTAELTVAQDFKTQGQLSAIVCANEHCVVTGFGEFWSRSFQTGIWQGIRTPSDFFTDLDKVGDSIWYACGLRGTILKSVDGGQNWDELIKGNKFWSDKKALKAIDFEDQNTGVVVGERGFCQITFDGGERWEEVRNLPIVDFTNVAILNNTAVLVGAEGTIIRISWP